MGGRFRWRVSLSPVLRATFACALLGGCDADDPFDALLDAGDSGSAADAQVLDADVEPPPPNDDRDAALDAALSFDSGHDDDAGWEPWVEDHSALPTEGYWAGTARELLVTATGHHVALACHNCYESGLGDSDANLSATLDRLHAAQRGGFDLLELDLKDEGGVWHIDHDDTGTTTGALADEVLFDDELRVGNQLLFLELKETLPEADSLRSLLELIVAAGYAVAGRDVILRSFEATAANLDLLALLLEDSAFAARAPHFRLQLLLRRAIAEGLPDSSPFAGVVGPHVQGVELNEAAANVEALLAAARDQGLGTTVFNFAPSRTTEICARFSELADVLTIDGEVGPCLAGIAGP